MASQGNHDAKHSQAPFPLNWQQHILLAGFYMTDCLNSQEVIDAIRAKCAQTVYGLSEVYEFGVHHFCCRDASSDGLTLEKIGTTTVGIKLRF